MNKGDVDMSMRLTEAYWMAHNARVAHQLGKRWKMKIIDVDESELDRVYD